MFRWRERGKLSAEVFEPISRQVRLALQHGVEQRVCSRTANMCANLLKLLPALRGLTTTHPGAELRISAIVDTSFRLIVEYVSTPSWKRGGCAQARSSMCLNRPRSV